MMENFALIELIFSVFLSVLFIYAIISQIREEYSSEVYTTWYTFSFSFLICLTIALVSAHYGYNEDFFVESMRRSIVKELADVSKEATFVLVLLLVTIGPQILSYFLSGVFGCAAQPKFVNWIIWFISWSIIKSLATISGWELSELCAHLVLSGPKAALAKQNLLKEYGSINYLGMFVLSVYHIFFAFIVLLIYLRGADYRDRFIKKREWLRTMNAYMTKY